MIKLRLLATFYKSFVFVSWAITLFCLLMIFIQGIGIITPLFWFKLVTLAIIVLFINSYKRNDFYYYKNLGLSKKILWISTLVFDLVLFILLAIITGSIA